MAGLSTGQLREWLAYLHLEQEDAREAALDAELEASARARAAAVRRHR